MGKKKQSLNPDISPSSSAFSELSKLSQKELGQKMAAATPDVWDLDNIALAIGRFEYEHPGRIKKMFTDVCTEMAMTGVDKYARLSKDSDLRRAFWLPDARKGFSLSKFMETAYPSLWVNKKHADWFIRHFPEFSFEYAAKQVKTR